MRLQRLDVLVALGAAGLINLSMLTIGSLVNRGVTMKAAFGTRRRSSR